MKEKPLKRMGRAELLQMLIERTRELEALQEQMDELTDELQTARAELDRRTLAVQNAGSLAEASVQINGMIEAAQKTADQYLYNIERMQREQEAACQQMAAQAKTQAEQIIRDAEKRAQQIESEAHRKCDELMHTARQDAGRNWNELSGRLDKISAENEELRGLLTETPKKRRKWQI